MPLLLVNRVNIYKTLYYLTSDITSLTYLLPHFAFSCFLLHWPSFCFPLTDQVFSHYGLFPQWATHPFGVYSRVSFSGGLPGSPFSTCPYYLAIMYDISCILFLFSLSVYSLFLSVYTWNTLSSWWKGFLLFMFTTKRLYPVLRAFCNNW